MRADKAVTLVEVGPRDGFQPIVPFIPTAQKIHLIESLHAAGLRRIEATAFVSEKAVPQLADAELVLANVRALPDIDPQVLVPNARYAQRALAAGVDHIVYVLSVSEKHNMSNVRRSPTQSAEDYCALVADLPANIRVRLNVATAFDCPFDGPVAPEATLDLLSAVIPACPSVEIALCDTTGRVTPDRVTALFETASGEFSHIDHWAFHAHDTYGVGVANVLAAYDVGVRIFDSSFAGLGGCPFAPGATGNVATEDLVWTFDQMAIATGVRLDALLTAAREGAALPGALPGGRVRNAKHVACAGDSL